MDKYALAFLSIIVALPVCIYSQDSTALLHQLADKKELTTEEQEVLDEVLKDPTVEVNKTEYCLTPLCKAFCRGNLFVAQALARHTQIDLTLPSTILWGKGQLLSSPIESAAKDPAVCAVLEKAVPIKQLLCAAMSIPMNQRSEALQRQIECWRQKLAIEVCLAALGDKVSQEVASLLQGKSPHPAPAA
jgi:hypothetical protein